MFDVFVGVTLFKCRKFKAPEKSCPFHTGKSSLLHRIKLLGAIEGV